MAKPPEAKVKEEGGGGPAVVMVAGGSKFKRHSRSASLPSGPTPTSLLQPSGLTSPSGRLRPSKPPRPKSGYSTNPAHPVSPGLAGMRPRSGSPLIMKQRTISEPGVPGLLSVHLDRLGRVARGRSLAKRVEVSSDLSWSSICGACGMASTACYQCLHQQHAYSFWHIIWLQIRTVHQRLVVVLLLVVGLLANAFDSSHAHAAACKSVGDHNRPGSCCDRSNKPGQGN